MSNEILINYKKEQSWTRSDVDDIGATTSTTLRTVTTSAPATTNYVRKFGVEYKITDISGDNYVGFMSFGETATWRFYGADTNTLLYTIIDANSVITVIDGATLSTAEQLKVTITFSSTTATIMPAGFSFDINTDIDPSGKTLYFSSEDPSQAGDLTTFFVSSNGYTYYDSDLTYGGHRHTPAVGNPDLPYFDIETANAALGSRTIVEVLDSEYYQCNNLSPTGGKTWQAALGQTPTLYRCSGFNKHNVPFNDMNNQNTIFVDYINGNDSNSGAHDYPRKTIGASIFTLNTAFIAGNFTYTCIINDGDVIETATNVNSTATTNRTYKLVSAPKKTPTIKLNSLGGWWFFCSSTGVFVEMYNINVNINGNNLVCATTNAVTPANSPNFENCTFYNSTNAQLLLMVQDADITDCYFYDNTASIAVGLGHSTFVGTYTATGNKCVNNGTGISFTATASGASATIENNLCYRNIVGIEVTFPTGVTATVSKCTSVGNSTGISAAGSGNPTITNNILWSNAAYDLWSGGVSQTLTYSVYGTLGAGCTDGGNNVTSDPIFKNVDNDEYIIDTSSPAYRTASDGDMMGIRRKMITIAGNTTIINGFIFDDEADADFIIFQSATRTDCEYKWLTIVGTGSVAIDNYGTSITKTIINNCDIGNNVDGIICTDGENYINKNLIYNTKKNIYIDGNDNTIIKCSIGGGTYGIWFGTSATDGNTIKNTVSSGNTLWNLYSTYNVFVWYSCFATGNVSEIISQDNEGMVLDSALFINTTPGLIDLHLKRTEEGYLFDSPCIDAASDGGDMGVYTTSYQTSSYSWRKYQFENNPQQNMHFPMVKNAQGEDNILGDFTLYADAQKRKFPMIFPSYTTRTQRLKVQYLNSFHPSRENELSRADTIMRMSLLPDTYLDSGSGAMLDYTNTWDSVDKLVKVTDSANSLVENEWKGYHLSIEFDSATDAVIDATAKTITKTGAFTGSDWTGYFVKHNNYFYFIASNTNDALTVLDPDSTLINETKSIKVEKYFKIVSNDTQDFYIYDEDSELSGLDGTYNYVIDFIEVVVQIDDQKFNQNLYSELEENTKSQYQLFLEEA